MLFGFGVGNDFCCPESLIPTPRCLRKKQSHKWVCLFPLVWRSNPYHLPQLLPCVHYVDLISSHSTQGSCLGRTRTVSRASGVKRLLLKLTFPHTNALEHLRFWKPAFEEEFSNINSLQTHLKSNTPKLNHQQLFHKRLDYQGWSWPLTEKTPKCQKAAQVTERDFFYLLFSNMDVWGT